MTRLEEIQFEKLVREFRDDPRLQEMKNYIQHGTITTFDHVLSVARECFRLNRQLHLHVNERELIRSAMLHDYFLYDWHNHGDHLHGYHHPQIAADNAARDFEELTDKEKRAIETHMWPLTLTQVPVSRMGWLLTISDKIVSTRETLFCRS